MRRNHRRIACTAGLAALVLAAAAAAQDRQVYRYTEPDGRVVYSDRPPPSEVKNLQQRKLGANFVESEDMPLATRQASERFPVTLYTFQCGETCQSAEALLNRRGVPFATVNVQEPANAQKLQQLTGEMSAPVLQVGDKLIAKGFNESKWTALLDEAGYPKAAPPRRTAARAPAEARETAAVQSATPQPGGGYPK